MNMPNGCPMVAHWSPLVMLKISKNVQWWPLGPLGPFSGPIGHAHWAHWLTIGPIILGPMGPTTKWVFVNFKYLWVLIIGHNGPNHQWAHWSLGPMSPLVINGFNGPIEYIGLNEPNEHNGPIIDETNVLTTPGIPLLLPHSHIERSEIDGHGARIWRSNKWTNIRNNGPNRR